MRIITQAIRVIDYELSLIHISYIHLSDPNYPSINSIIQSAVYQCKRETDGPDYQNK